jgi:hypothetical protein
MLELILKNGALPMQQQRDELEREFVSWKGELEQVDDICIIGVRIR